MKCCIIDWWTLQGLLYGAADAWKMAAAGTEACDLMKGENEEVVEEL
jgi:hypothetical protein